MSEPQYDGHDMNLYYEFQEVRLYKRQRDELLSAARAVIQRADEEGWLCYNGTDESRLELLENAIDKVERGD